MAGQQWVNSYCPYDLRSQRYFFLGAIYPQGCIELKNRAPVSSNRKSKLDSGKNESDAASKYTIANHFYHFI